MNSFSQRPTAVPIRGSRSDALASPSSARRATRGSAGQAGWARPRLARAQAWWLGAFADRIPGRRDLDPLSMPVPLLPLAVVAERCHDGTGGADWCVRLAGTIVCERAGRELRGQRFRAAFGDIAPQQLDGAITAIVAHSRPTTFRHTIADGWGGLEWAETGLFPLSESRDRVDGLLAFIDPDQPHS